MDRIPREKMGYATSLFNLMRNIGGSVGIAVTGTILQRQRQTTATLLGEHIEARQATGMVLIAAGLAVIDGRLLALVRRRLTVRSVAPS